MRRRKTARIADIAQTAGVGTATVDRVLHGRGGVSAATTERVKAAERALTAQVKNGRAGSQVAAGRRIDVVLPADAGPSTETLGAALKDAGARNNLTISCAFVEKMNPAALATRLRASERPDCAGVAFQALDHPLVRDAVARLEARGVPAVALMSDLDGSRIINFVGMDNRAAGRTAGLLLGRLVRGPGRVAVLWGGQLYRSHEEREIGFRSLIRAEFPELEILDLVSGGDHAAKNYHRICSVLDNFPDLIGIYNVGGGNRGVVKALKENDRADAVTLIGHNLTPTTRDYLIDGSMDAIIHQDMDLAANMAIQTLLDHAAGRPAHAPRLPIEIILRENMQRRQPRLQPGTTVPNVA